LARLVYATLRTWSLSFISIKRIYFMLETAELCQAMLPYVAFYGWTEEAAQAALKDLGYPPETLSLFAPNGFMPLVKTYCHLHDEQLLDSTTAQELDPFGVTQKITYLVKKRILLHLGQEEVLRRSLAFFMRPWNTVQGVQCLWA